MTLVKLDSGDYINTMYVIKTMTDTAGSVGKKNGQLVYLLDTGYQKITSADRDRIVKVMSGTAVTLPLLPHQYGPKPFSDDDFKISDKS